MEIDLGEGLALALATQDDIDEIHATLRPGDAAEHEFDRKDLSINDLKGAMVVRFEDKPIGYIGAAILPCEAVMSPRRFIYYLSTTHANAIKLTYVKRSKEVFRAFLETQPPWVEELVAFPMPDKYPMSCKWLERVIGFHFVKDFEVNGYKFRFYRISRKEI